MSNLPPHRIRDGLLRPVTGRRFRRAVRTPLSLPGHLLAITPNARSLRLMARRIECVKSDGYCAARCQEDVGRW